MVKRVYGVVVRVRVPFNLAMILRDRLRPIPLPHSLVV